jgi:hypothetical protein
MSGADVLAAGVRDENGSRLGRGFEPRRDIDTVAVGVATLGDHVAATDPDPRQDAPLVRNVPLTVEHPAPDLHRAAHGVYNPRELRPQAVAGVPYRAAPMLLDDLRLDAPPEMGFAASGRPLFIRSHQTVVARDIGRGECREPANDPLLRQRPPPTGRIRLK